MKVELDMIVKPPHKLRYLYCSAEAPWNAEGWLAVEAGKPAVKFAFRANIEGVWFFCIHETDTLGVLLGEIGGFVQQGTGCATLQHVRKIILEGCIKYCKRNGRLLTQRVRDAQQRGIMDEKTTEFIMVCDQMSRRLGRPLILSQMLEVALYLGYRKVAKTGEHKIWSDE